MRACLGLDQLNADSHPVASLADATFEHIAHAQLAAYPFHVDTAALVREAGIALENEEPADTREPSDYLLDHAVRKVFLLGITAQIGEGQDCDRRLVGERQCRCRRAPGG